MKTIHLAIAASAALSLGACGGGESSTSSSNNGLASQPQGTGGANLSAGLNSSEGGNAAAGSNSSIGAPGNQLGRGNTIVGSAPSDATDGDSVSNTSGQIKN